MPPRRTAILAAAFALLAIYFAAFERHPKAPRSPGAARSGALLDCGTDLPSRLVVSSSKGIVSAERAGDRWATAAPTFASTGFASLAEILCRIPITDRLGAEGRPAEFGLDEPAAEVEIGFGGGSRRLRLGAATPAGNHVYVTIGGSPEVLRVGIELAHAIERLAAYAIPPAS
jgi:hypothetical protein